MKIELELNPTEIKLLYNCIAVKYDYEVDREKALQVRYSNKAIMNASDVLKNATEKGLNDSRKNQKFCHNILKTLESFIK